MDRWRRRDYSTCLLRLSSARCVSPPGSFGCRFLIRMSMYGSQNALNMSRRVGSKGDLTGGGTHHYARSEVVHGGGNGYDPYLDGYNTYTFSKSSMGGIGGGMGGGMSGDMGGGMIRGMGGGMMSVTGGGMMSGMSGGKGSGMGGGMRYAFIFRSMLQQFNLRSPRCHLLPVSVARGTFGCSAGRMHVGLKSWFPLNINHESPFYIPVFISPLRTHKESSSQKALAFCSFGKHRVDQQIA